MSVIENYNRKLLIKQPINSLLSAKRLKGQYHKKIIRLLTIPIKYHLKINYQDASSFSISCLVLARYSSFKTGKLKLICDVIYSRIRNEIYETKNISGKVGKIYPIFSRICSYTILLFSCKV